MQDNATTIVSVLAGGTTSYPQVKDVTINNPRVTSPALPGSSVVFMGAADRALKGGMFSGDCGGRRQGY